MKRNIKSFICIVLLAAFAMTASGCKPGGTGTARTGTVDLMKGITAQHMSFTPAAPEKAQTDRAAGFGVDLFKACFDGENNCLVSPLSVLSALSMTVNGAKGETLEAMEKTLGMTADELNRFYADYCTALPSGDKYKLNLANSIWFTSDPRLTVERSFLQTNADYYGAEIYKADFDDQTLSDINRWVKEKTDGMIPEILDRIPPEAVMYLINALAFDAEWETVYRENEVYTRDFTLENGEKREAEYMYSEHEAYIGDENADGFVKYYSGRKYAFAALLPKEGMTVAEYVKQLDGETLMKLLAGAGSESAAAVLPKFETKFDIELSKVLTAMGMGIAFDAEAADFSGLGVSSFGNIRISRVIHKTFISVDERGTKAGAATAVEMTDEAFYLEKEVVLNRPFVYMLIDCETNLPFFIGTMMDVEG
ncbi:MAG: serpin family protein [Clostridiales bacterium]|nr:serpin family protein [Clostridiales bacterium]